MYIHIYMYIYIYRTASGTPVSDLNILSTCPKPQKGHQSNCIPYIERKTKRNTERRKKELQVQSDIIKLLEKVTRGLAMKGQAFQQMCHKALCERLAMTTRIENAERQINIDCYEI